MYLIPPCDVDAGLRYNCHHEFNSCVVKRVITIEPNYSMHTRVAIVVSVPLKKSACDSSRINV